MSSVLTIRNLDETVKRRLRLRAAQHNRSMEAEARDIIARAVGENETEEESRDAARRAMEKGVEALQQIWTDRMSTDEIMKDLRGDD